MLGDELKLGKSAHWTYQTDSKGACE